MSFTFRELTKSEIAKMEKAGLTCNPCESCDGTGRAEAICSGSINDPDAVIYTDDCEECAGTGDGKCPTCDNPAPMLIESTRCQCCISLAP